MAEIIGPPRTTRTIIYNLVLEKEFESIIEIKIKKLIRSCMLINIRRINDYRISMIFSYDYENLMLMKIKYDKKKKGKEEFIGK